MYTDEFIDLVKRMRTAQKEYFRTRSKTALIESKELERQVDRALAAGVNDLVTTTASPKEQRELRLHLDERDEGLDTV